MTVDTAKLRELIDKATSGPIILATSNSWRRILSATRSTPVCVPCSQPDGHSDLHFPNGEATGPDATLLIEAWNHAPALLDHIDAQAAEIAKLRDALEAAKNGLSWYHDEYPETVNGCDEEAMHQIDAALSHHQGETT